MQSLWDYIRFRTRDAMLAGMQDALDQAEADDNPAGREDAAGRFFLERRSQNPSLAPPPSSQPAPKAIERHEGGNGQAAPRDRSAEAEDRVFARMADRTHAADPFEARLEETNPEFQEPHPDQAPRKRGRPRKNP